MKPDVLLGIVSSAGLVHAAFLIGLLLHHPKGDRRAHVLLALLLFSVLIRIAKSTTYALFGFTPVYFPVLGLIGMSISGPILYYYFLRLNRQWRAIKGIAYLHFAPTVLLLVLFFPFFQDWIWWGYLIVIVQTVIYLGYLLPFIFKKDVRGIANRWLQVCWGSLLGFWSIYLIQFIGIPDVGYIFTTAVAGALLFILSYLAVFRFEVLGKIHHYRLQQTHSSNNKLGRQLRQKLESPEVFRNADLTLAQLAQVLELSPSQLSRLIQIEFGQSFPEVINQLRISYAQQRLLDQRQPISKIEALAYESGFQSPSSFYAYFKKHVRMTPTEFRKKHSGEFLRR